jgi:tetratricopeptide (TPR) repeat protein
MGDLRQLTGSLLAAVTDGFTSVAEQILEEQRTLHRIAESLEHPHGSEVQELLREALRALDAGRHTPPGRDQEAEFVDASRLLRAVLVNPIGSRHDIAWFEMGWLYWRVHNDLKEAEAASYNAVRLSRSRADLYHVKSLCQLAEVQYLQGKYQEAYDTINAALSLSSDYRLLFDAARYAAKLGRTTDVLELAAKCIILQPHTANNFLNERDFRDVAIDLALLVHKKTFEARLWVATVVAAVRQSIVGFVPANEAFFLAEQCVM